MIILLVLCIIIAVLYIAVKLRHRWIMNQLFKNVRRFPGKSWEEIRKDATEFIKTNGKYDDIREETINMVTHICNKKAKGQ